MTDKKTEVLKLALDALERVLPHAKDSMTNPELDIDILDAHSAITAIREALALDTVPLAEQPAISAGPITPAMMMLLTTEQKRALLAMNKAEQPAQQQEPVLCINPKVIDPETGKVRNGTGALTYSDTPCAGWSLPLYTFPPASKPWVGLTDDEVDECYYWKGRQWTTDELVRHVEAKLREKNA